MADLRITCPHCNQDITCDELWAGHELQCPVCQGSFTVPAPAEAAPAHSPLVPKPPSGGKAGLALSQHAQVPATPGKNIPIRNLAAPPPKKTSPAIQALIAVVVIAALGAGGYFGYTWWQDRKEKAAADSSAPAKKADANQAAAADPNAAAQPRSRSRNRANPSDAQAAATDPSAGAATAAGASNALPLVPAVWTLDVTKAKIPDGKANGKISGTNFVAEAARIDTVGTAQVLRLLQGSPLSPDREVLVYLHLKPGEQLGGQNMTVSSDMKGTGVPQVAKRWKPNPRYAPSLKSYNFGYAMKLQLGQTNEEGLPGKIFLALDDPEQTVVAGAFKATIYQPDPNLQPATMVAPTPNPMTTPGRSAMDSRYGIRR